MSAFQPNKVLLIYPRIPNNTYWSFAYALSFINKKAAMPPLGLLTVAAMLPECWTPRLVDENVRPLSEEDLHWCDMVFISSMIVQCKRVQELVARCRRAGKTIVVGGPYPTQFYEQIKGVDHFVLGEAESGALSRFLADWNSGQAKKAYVSQVIRNRTGEREMDIEELERLRNFFGSDNMTECCETYPSLEKSPIPRYDLLDVKAYGSMSIQLSRGCPFACEFCSEPTLFGHRPRLKSGEQIIRELDCLRSLGFRGSVFFVDDNFIGNIKKVMEILDRIAEYQRQRDFPFAFYTEASLNLAANPDLMQRMRKAGFNMVFVGLETTDAATLEAANKSQNTGRNLLEDVRKIQRFGMEVTAGFIVGMDREPDDICEQIHRFCQQAGIPTVMAGLLEPLRGAPLFTRLSREGRLLGEPLGGSNTHSFKMNFVPDRGRRPEAILAGYKRLLANLFNRNGRDYFARVERLLGQLGENPAKRKIGRDEIGALGKSLFRQPFAGYGRAYVRFILRTLFRCPKRIPEAIRLSITGHHFIKITGDALQADLVKTELVRQANQVRQWIAALRQSRNNIGEQVNVFIRQQRKSMKKLRKRIAAFPAEHRYDLQNVYTEVMNNFRELQGKMSNFCR